MKKAIVITLLLVIISALCYFGYNAIQKRARITASEKKSEYLPQLTFYQLNETPFTYQNPKEKQTVIIYFHPECEHCQYEAQELLANKTKFVNTKILMVSPAPLAQLKQFYTDYQLAEISFLNVLWDKERKFEGYFGASTFPTIFIYNGKNKLLKKYKGEAKIEAILKHLKALPKEKAISLNSSSKTNFTNLNIIIHLFDLGLQ